MEMIRINDAKLKIMLSSDDLKEFEIESDNLDYGNTETKRMLWDLLNRAKHRIGFDTDGYRVLVHLYPSKSGGCELFVTKLSLPAPSTQATDRHDHEPLLHCKPSHASNAVAKKTLSFGFDHLFSLLSACRRLLGIGYEGRSDAFAGDDGRYYLLLFDREIEEYCFLDEYSFLVEYGTSENTAALEGLLGEHGKILCEKNAVERLGILA